MKKLLITLSFAAITTNSAIYSMESESPDLTQSIQPAFIDSRTRRLAARAKKKLAEQNRRLLLQRKALIRELRERDNDLAERIRLAKNQLFLPRRPKVQRIIEEKKAILSNPILQNVLALYAETVSNEMKLQDSIEGVRYLMEELAPKLHKIFTIEERGEIEDIDIG